MSTRVVEDLEAEVERLKIRMGQLEGERELWKNTAEQWERERDEARAALTSKEPHLAAFIKTLEMQRDAAEQRAEDFIAIAGKEQAKIEAALALHEDREGYCVHCSTGTAEEYPCPTVEALTGGREK